MLGQILSKSAGLFYCSLAKPDSFTQRPDVVTWSTSGLQKNLF